MRFEFGDIVLVPFPFTSQAASKKRPAVVVSSSAYNTSRLDAVVMAITSQLRAGAASDELWVRNWKTAGLLKPSAIKPVFATIEQSLVIRQLGTLDRQTVASPSHRAHYRMTIVRMATRRSGRRINPVA
jgi:mRNA interferase MazF